jgi:hypothetical protein
MTDRLERNTQAVVAFYDLMFNQCRPAEAVERYVLFICIPFGDVRTCSPLHLAPLTKASALAVTPFEKALTSTNVSPAVSFPVVAP